MRRIKRDVYKAFLVIGLILFVPLACSVSDIVQPDDDVTVEELLQNESFQSLAENNKTLNEPVLRKILAMSHNELLELHSRVGEEIESLQNKPADSITKEPEFAKIIELMGYESISQYEKIMTEIRLSKEKLLDKYPEINNKSNNEISEIFNQAVLKYYDRNPFNSLDDIKQTRFDRIFCEDPEGAGICLQQVLHGFLARTTMCSLRGLVVGVFCQWSNILRFEKDKQNCLVGNCE